MAARACPAKYPLSAPIYSRLISTNTRALTLPLLLMNSTSLPRGPCCFGGAVPHRASLLPAALQGLAAAAIAEEGPWISEDLTAAGCAETALAGFSFCWKVGMSKRSCMRGTTEGLSDNSCHNFFRCACRAVASVQLLHRIWSYLREGYS